MVKTAVVSRERKPIPKDLRKASRLIVSNPNKKIIGKARSDAYPRRSSKSSDEATSQTFDDHDQPPASPTSPIHDANPATANTATNDPTSLTPYDAALIQTRSVIQHESCFVMPHGMTGKHLSQKQYVHVINEENALKCSCSRYTASLSDEGKACPHIQHTRRHILNNNKQSNSLQSNNDQSLSSAHDEHANHVHSTSSQPVILAYHNDGYFISLVFSVIKDKNSYPAIVRMRNYRLKCVFCLKTETAVPKKSVHLCDHIALVRQYMTANKLLDPEDLPFMPPAEDTDFVETDEEQSSWIDQKVISSSAVD